MSPPISRRSFLETANASLAASVLASTATDVEAAGLYSGEIVDTHLHLWDLKVLRLPWVASATGKAKDVLAHDHLLADYARASEGLKVTRAVSMEVDVAEEDEVKEAEYVTKLCQEGRSPMQAAVISGRPASRDFASYLDRFKGNRFVKGLRQVLHTPATPPKYCLEDTFVNGVRLLGDRGLSFDLCLKNDQLEVGAELIDRCPRTQFILDHCGNPHAGSSDLWRLARGLGQGRRDEEPQRDVQGFGHLRKRHRPGLAGERLAPVVRSVIDLFGWDRVMFAGDWPVVNLGASLKVWAETLKQIVREDSPANQSKLFRDNAIKFYGLT